MTHSLSARTCSPPSRTARRRPAVPHAGGHLARGARLWALQAALRHINSD